MIEGIAKSHCEARQLKILGQTRNQTNQADTSRQAVSSLQLKHGLTSRLLVLRNACQKLVLEGVYFSTITHSVRPTFQGRNGFLLDLLKRRIYLEVWINWFGSNWNAIKSYIGTKMKYVA